MSSSLQLDSDPASTTFWDLELVSSNGGLSLAVIDGNAALAQNAATALDTFLGEVWYDTTLGLPYLQQILGLGRVPLAFIKARVLATVQAVSGVASAACYLTGPVNRTVGGQVQLRGSAGALIGTLMSTNLGGALPWFVSGATEMGLPGRLLTGGGATLTGGGSPLTGGDP